MYNSLKYDTLVSILDKLSGEAPKEFKTYHPDPENQEGINKSRAKSFIHLFLKVKCNLNSFRERFSNITDEVNDGGIDAFYFDYEKKILFLIQSKFRIDPNNFVHKSITADDIIKMEITNILKGTNIDLYNDKIKKLNKIWQEINDHANWVYKVVFLGNITRYSDDQIKRLIDNSNYEIYDFERTYNEFVFPLCSGTFYDPKEKK
jgi:hypothetical protein